MEQYIPKSAIVAKITKRFDEYSSSILRHYDACTEARASELGKILTILNTLEVKEVDLEKSISDWLSEGLPNDEEEIDYIKETAKHFFELGMAVSNKAQKGK